MEGVEEEGHCSGKDTLDLLDLVAGLDEVVDGADDGEAGAARGLVVEVAAGCVAAVTGGREDGVPEGEGVADALLVGSHNVDAGGEEGGVLGGDVERGGVVNEDDLSWGGLEPLEGLGWEGWRGDVGGLEISGPVGEVETGVVAGDEAFGGAGDEERNDGTGGCGVDDVLELWDEGGADGSGT